MPRRALNSSLQFTVSRPQAEQCPSIEHRIAPRPQISNRRRTVSSSFISLNRYTTLKIAGAAHKLSTSRYSEHTFWKLPGTGHKMTIKVVTLSKVCEHRVAREELEQGRERLSATQSPAGPGPSLAWGCAPHNCKAGPLVMGPHPGGWALGPASDWMYKVRH